MTAAAGAAWPPAYQHYLIQRIGLTDADHTGPSGQTLSSSISFSPTLIAGTSQNFITSSPAFSRDSWVWNGVSTVPIGLLDAPHIGSTGHRYSTSTTSNGHYVAGSSARFTGVNTSNGEDAWVWNRTSTVQVGLTGNEYTGSGGFAFSAVTILSESGGAYGTSRRITGTDTNNGADAWYWNGHETMFLGLTGDDYISGTGKRTSGVMPYLTTTFASGLSFRYIDADTDHGSQAWHWDGSTITPIGLADGVYSGTTGYRYSSPTHITGPTLVFGYSKRFADAQTDRGQDVWVWNGATTTPIGMNGGPHTRSDGYQHGSVTFASEADQAVGYALRFTPTNADNGRDAWVWKNGATTQLGLTGGVYTGNAGYQYTHAVRQNLAGQVIGYSSRFEGEKTNLGRDAWVWNGAVSEPIGLTGEGYTGITGYRHSEPTFHNAAGHVIGISKRILVAVSDHGQDTWVWKNGATTRIGLTGTAYESSTGYRSSQPYVMIANDRITGYSTRFTPAQADNGRDAWIFDGSAITQIGLTDSDHIGAGGRQHTTINDYTDSGVVVGITLRSPAASTSKGQDVWYYDPTTGQTTPLIFSVRASDGFAYSEVRGLNDDGTLFGIYRSYLSDGNYITRAFLFRPDLGTTHLDDLVAGGITAAGWASLDGIGAVFSGLSVISGGGKVTGPNNNSSFVLLAARGACCNGVTCSITDHTNCVAPGTRFAGNGAACNPPGNSTTPCCLANFDQSNSGVTVDDLFQYLNAWFLSSPRADANQSDSITIDDLFIYLNTWFTGC